MNELRWNFLVTLFKRLIEARKSDLVFEFGQFKGITVNNILAFSRTVDIFYYETVTFVNFNSEVAYYDFSQDFGNRFQKGIVYILYQIRAQTEISRVTLLCGFKHVAQVPTILSM